MLMYFHLQEVDPGLSRIWISDFQEDERAFLTIDEPGDLFLTLEEHPSVVVGARVDPGQTYFRTLRDLHFYAVDLDQPEQLGPLLVRIRNYEGTLTMPSLSKYIYQLPPSDRVVSQRAAANQPPARPVEAVAPGPQPIRSQTQAANDDGNWFGFLRRLPGLHR